MINYGVNLRLPLYVLSTYTCIRLFSSSQYNRRRLFKVIFSTVLVAKLLFSIKIDVNTPKIFSANYSNSLLFKHILLYIKTFFAPPLSLAKEHVFCYYDIVTEKRVNHRPRKA